MEDEEAEATLACEDAADSGADPSVDLGLEGLPLEALDVADAEPLNAETPEGGVDGRLADGGVHLEKGHMLMLISSAFPTTLLTRRSIFLLSFCLNVTAGRSSVGAGTDSAGSCRASPHTVRLCARVRLGLATAGSAAGAFGPFLSGLKMFLRKLFLFGFNMIRPDVC